MKIYPDSSFPLSASDQADVIRLFQELMSVNGPAGHSSDAATNQSVAPRKDSNGSRFPAPMPDFE